MTPETRLIEDIKGELRKLGASEHFLKKVEELENGASDWEMWLGFFNLYHGVRHG